MQPLARGRPLRAVPQYRNLPFAARDAAGIAPPEAGRVRQQGFDLLVKSHLFGPQGNRI